MHALHAFDISRAYAIPSTLFRVSLCKGAKIMKSTRTHTHTASHDGEKSKDERQAQTPLRRSGFGLSDASQGLRYLRSWTLGVSAASWGRLREALRGAGVSGGASESEVLWVHGCIGRRF